MLWNPRYLNLQPPLNEHAGRTRRGGTHAQTTRTRHALTLSRSRHANKAVHTHSNSPSRPQPPLHAARTTHPPTGTAHTSQFSPTQSHAGPGWGKTASALTPLPWLSPRDPPPPPPAPILLRFYSSILPCRPRIPATERISPHIQPPSALAKQCQGSHQAVPRSYPGCREGALTWRRWHLRVGDPPRGRRGARPGHGQGWE